MTDVINETQQGEAVEGQTEAPAVTQEQATPAVVETAQATVTEEAPVQPEAAVAEEAPVQPEAVVEESQPQVPLTAFQKTMAELKETGTNDQVALIANIDKYMVDMMPGKPVTAQDGAMIQAQFWTVLKNVIERSPDGQFRNLWSIILAYFNEYGNGVFAESYIYRFTEQWLGARRELDAYLRVLNLIKVSADPKTRSQTKKQVDIEKTIQSLSEVGRNRLISFYAK